MAVSIERRFARDPIDRGAPLWGAGRLEPHLLTVWLLVRVRPAPPRIRAHRRFPLLWKCPSIAGLFELECFVSDKVSWSDTPTFHNTLVVGSSPTSSTTHSSYRKIQECPPMPGFYATGEFSALAALSAACSGAPRCLLGQTGPWHLAARCVRVLA